MSRVSVKIPFDCTVPVLKTMVKEVLDFYKTRIASEWMSKALHNGLDFETFRAFNAAVFKVSQDIKFATKSKTHEILWKTDKPFVSAKRLLGWIITGKDFKGVWASYTDVLDADHFYDEVVKAFSEVSEGNKFELVFVDAARFTEDTTPEGDLIPVLTWLKPELAPKTGPYKTAAQQNITTVMDATPTPARTIESTPVENLAAAAGAGGASWADMVEKLPVKAPADSKEEPTELQITSAIMLLQTLVGPKHALTYKTIDTLAVTLVTEARKLIET
jgi:hypothetical protein